MDILVKRIKQWRYDHYVTQQQLADRLGCPRNTLQCWETGRRSPGCEALAELCRAMDVSADWLLGLSEEPGQCQTLASPKEEITVSTASVKVESASSTASIAD